MPKSISFFLSLSYLLKLTRMKTSVIVSILSMLIIATVMSTSSADHIANICRTPGNCVKCCISASRQCRDENVNPPYQKCHFSSKNRLFMTKFNDKRCGNICKKQNDNPDGTLVRESQATDQRAFSCKTCVQAVKGRCMIQGWDCNFGDLVQETCKVCW